MTPSEARKLLINLDLEFCTDQNGYPYVRNLSDQGTNIDWQTKARGTNEDEYDIYLAYADDGTEHEIMTGEPLKTYDEWLNS